MIVIAWNSLGDKWGPFWTNWVSGAIANNRNQDVVALLTEASWAPWMTPNRSWSVDVQDSSAYEFVWRENTAEYVDGKKSSFCIGINEERNRSAFWVPWVGSFDSARTNSRCSMGGAASMVWRRRGEVMGYSQFPGLQLKKEMWRPAVRVNLTRAGNLAFAVFSVHLVSGWPAGAQDELAALLRAIPSMVGSSIPALVVGDMNIDISGSSTANVQATAPKGWRVLRSGSPTHRSGGELDWAFLYDPNGQLGNASAGVVGRYDSYPNDSDHAVMAYQIPDV
jgi:hypothetical protein